MKILKALTITLIAVLLTGCYTQLQYSQTMKKITDDKPKKATGYTYSGDQEKAEQEPVTAQEQRTEEQYQEEGTYAEDYVPIHYKDYEYAEKYDECRCSPYNVYNFYGSHYDWHGYGYNYPHFSYGSYFSISPFYYSRWHHRRFFGGPYFAVTFSWGNPFHYHSFYYDSFYDPFYGPYWYRYRSPFAYNYHKYYGSFGYGYYSGGGKDKIDRNTRYGPRSIGNNRVGDSSVRSRDARTDGRRATVGNVSSTRTRSVGTSRTTTNRTRGTKVERTRNRGSQSQGSSNQAGGFRGSQAHLPGPARSCRKL